MSQVRYSFYSNLNICSNLWHSCRQSGKSSPLAHLLAIYICLIFWTPEHCDEHWDRNVGRLGLETCMLLHFLSWTTLWSSVRTLRVIHVNKGFIETTWSRGWSHTGTGSPVKWSQYRACRSSRGVWTKLSETGSDFWVILYGARSWTRWSFQLRIFCDCKCKLKEGIQNLLIFVKRMARS